MTGTGEKALQARHVGSLWEGMQSPFLAPGSTTKESKQNKTRKLWSKSEVFFFKRRIPVSDAVIWDFAVHSPRL